MEPGGISKLEASDESFRGLRAAECAMLLSFGHESEHPWVHRPLGKSPTIGVPSGIPTKQHFYRHVEKILTSEQDISELAGDKDPS